LRCARKPIKGSKDSGDNLYSKKKLEPNNCSLGWHPGPGKDGQKTQMLPLMTSPTKNLKIKSKKFS